MRKRKASNVSSERRNWENIFNGLVRMLRNMQQQLQVLVKERKFLEDRIKMQHDGWVSDVCFYKDRISEMEGLQIFEEKKRLLERAKADFVLGSEHREACITKWILEHLESELEDFKACFECLSHKRPNGEDQGPISEDTEKNQIRTRSSGKKSTKNVVGEDICSKKVEEELRRLKREYEKLTSKKDSEVSALLAEKNFVWNQYNIMENDHLSKLRNKHTEVERANEKISTLISTMEQLQSAVDEKDATISRLENKVAYLEADAKKLSEDKSKLSAELESLKSRNTQVTPVLNHCTTGNKSSETNKSSRSGNNITMKKETSAPNASGSSKDSGKQTRSLKWKEGPVITPSETPKLFSSKFKVPKLKNPSPSIR